MGFNDDMTSRTFGEKRMRLCCHTCSSWRPPTGFFSTEGYCNDRRNGSELAPENEWECVCEHWKPSKAAIKTALSWKGNAEH